MDCDLSVPTMPTPNLYDGGINNAAQYLIKNRPNGWREELGKLQNMSESRDSCNKLDQKAWQVRFRHISPGVVIPQQVGESTKSYF